MKTPHHVAYFNAGLRIVDISDPFKPKEVGYYIPEGAEKTSSPGRKVIQTNDVDLDYRGLIYITVRSQGLSPLPFLKGGVIIQSLIWRGTVGKTRNRNIFPLNLWSPITTFRVKEGFIHGKWFTTYKPLGS
jgi:hypothetical protein